jgi:hypothetical protein
MSSTPPPPQTPLPVHYPGTGRRVGHRLRPVVIAAIIAAVILISAAVTAAIVLIGTTSPPEPRPLLPSGHAATAVPAAVTLASADPINIAQGISITLVPGWTLADRGPNWVTLADPDDGARMRVTVKPAGGADVLAVLQADINNELARTVLTNVTMLGGPAAKTVQGHNFQRAASQDYTADHTVMVATTHLLGAFVELLNPSNQLSAFIDYRQSRDSPTQAAIGSQVMINSML